MEWLRRLFGCYEPEPLPRGEAQRRADAFLAQHMAELAAESERLQALHRMGDPIAEGLNRSLGLPPGAIVFDPRHGLR